MAKKLNVKLADRQFGTLSFKFFMDNWPKSDLKTRDIWADRIRTAVSQPDFKSEPVLRKFLVYILVGSKKYSALASVKKTDYPKKRDVEKVIVRVARLIQKKAPERELRAARAAADAAMRAADRVAADAYADAAYADAAAADVADYAADAAAASADSALGVDDARAAAYAADRAAFAAADRAAYATALNEYAAALLYFVEQQAYGRGKRRGNPSTEKVPSLEKLLGTRRASSRTSNPSKKEPVINGWEVYTYMSGPPHQWGARIRDPNGSGVHMSRIVNKCEFYLNVHTVDSQYGSWIQLELTSGCDPRFLERTTISARKYGLVLEAPKLQAEKVLKAATLWADKKIPKKQNPSKRSDSKPKAKKKTAKKATKRKAPLAKTLISKCQKTWDHYCERPSKKRLKEVFDHLEVMKESSAKTVKEERARCLRAANKEAKRLGMKK